MYGYMSGLEQPGKGFPVSPERRVGGMAIGILRTNCLIPMVPGDVGNATTFKFPVLYKVMDEVEASQIVCSETNPHVLNGLIKGGKELEIQGVRAISTTCGYFGNYQREVAQALNIPVFLSSLLQIPLINRAIKPDQKVGIICASATKFSTGLLAACGVDDVTKVVVTDFQGIPDAKNVLLGPEYFDSHKFEEGMIDLVKKFVSDNPDIGAILLECADLPPFAAAVRKTLNLQVYDLLTMVALIHRSFSTHL